MNFVASNYLSLKNQKSTTSGSTDIGIRKFEFVPKTQFLSPNFIVWNIKGVYDIGLQWYWNEKIRVCGKNIIPLK